MNRNRKAALAAALVCALFGLPNANAASFTYHGSLTTDGVPADGRYDIQLTVYKSSTSTVQLGQPTTVYGVDVHKGSFNTVVDLGAASEGGAWVAAAVRKAGAGDFEALSGRTPVAPDGTCPDAWLINGNSGTDGTAYVGTSDDATFSIGVNGDYDARFYDNGAVALAPYSAATPPGSYAVSMALSNGASGDYSIAGGYNAATANQGSIVFADRSTGPIVDTAQDQFIVEAGGGAMINTNALTFTYDDLEVHPRLAGDGGDDDADIALVSRNGSYGDIYMQDSTGILQIYGDNGVHVDNPVTIDGVLKTASIDVVGNATKATAGAWKANSDMRIKQNIESIPNALATLQQIHPVTFEYTDAYRAEHPEIAPQRYYNVLAQEFRQVFPDAVAPSGEYLPGTAKTPDNEVLQVDTYPAQIVTIAAVQELAQKNADLQRTVQKLMARVEKLEAAQGK